MSSNPPEIAIGRRIRLALLLAWPAVVLAVLTMVPAGLLFRISVAPQDPNQLWTDGLTLESYAGLAQTTLLHALAYSIELAVVVAAVSVGLGFPLTYFVTRMRRRPQVAWLIFLLATLSLSDVLIAFSWQVMLSKRIGVSNLFVALGLMDHADSLAPGPGAVIACLIYLVMPFTVLTLYPALSRLDWSQVEAARTLGASPFTAFFSVVIPLASRPALIAFLMAAVLTLGTYVPSMVLGKPQDWTMAVLIGNAALAGHDLPRAAAMSVLLLAVALLLALGTGAALRRRRTA